MARCTVSAAGPSEPLQVSGRAAGGAGFEPQAEAIKISRITN